MCAINCSGGCPECSPEDFTKEELEKHYASLDKNWCSTEKEDFKEHFDMDGV